jgi:hypothetical protein
VGLLSRRLPAGLVAVAAVGALLALGVSAGYPAERPHLLSGAAWLPSTQVGQLTLLDGASTEVAAQVQVAPSGHDLDAVQEGSTGYAVDRSAGSIRRVDGATFETTAPVTPIPGAQAGLEVFAGHDSVYALDTQRGVLTGADPKTLANRGGPVPLAARVTAAAATVDSAGGLWLLDTPTGDLVWFRDGQRRVRRNASTPGAGLLTVAGGDVVLVDTGRRTATVLDPRSAAPGTPVELDLRPGERVEVSGSTTGPQLYLVAARGVVIICDLRASCGSVVPLTGAGTDLGAAVETGGRLFVPDRTTGRVWIVDLKQARIVAQPRVVSPNTRFQLVARDGIVFFNDPDSERAGVLRLDGGVREVPKYDPKDPGKGVSNIGGREGGTAPSSSAGPLGGDTDPGTPPPPPPGTPPPGNSPPGSPPPGPPTPPTGPTGPTGPAPTVQITVSKTTALVGEQVALHATTSGDASLFWNYGDGQGDTGADVSHRWWTARTYEVSVQATFPHGRVATASVEIQVVAGSVAVGLSPTHGTPGSTTTVSGSGYLGCRPGKVDIRWAGAATGTQATVGANGGFSTPFHTPASAHAGNYQVSAVCADGTGPSAVATYTVTVPPGALSITLNPTSGLPGSSVTVNGKGYDACPDFGHRTVDVLWDGHGIGVTAPIRSDGTFSATFAVPNSPVSGNHTVYGRCQDGGEYATAIYTTGIPPGTLVVSLNPNHGPAGTSVSISGHGYNACPNYGHRTVDVLWNGHATGVTAPIRSDGTFSATFTVPANALHGNSYTVYGRCQDGGEYGTAPFTVT